MSWGIAETRRCEVLAPSRRVKDLTFESRMESLGFFFTARVVELRRRSDRMVGEQTLRCIADMQ